MPAPIDEKTKEGIIAEYALSNSVNGVAKKYSVSWATAKAIVTKAETEINQLREEKRQKYVRDAWEVVYVYLDKLMDPKTIKEAKARDCISVVTGMIERIQKQQELNQQFDVMYDNIADEQLRELFLEVGQTDPALFKEFVRFSNERSVKAKADTKEIVRMRLNEAVSQHIKIHDNSPDNSREELESLFYEVKEELLSELSAE